MDSQTATPQGSNAERTRSYNRVLVMGHVRAAGTCGRAEIARASGLSTQAVSNIIAELEAEGLLREAGRRAAGRGLPPVQYALLPEGGYAFGAEIRPDAIRAALLDLSGQACWSRRAALTRADPEAVAGALAGLRDAALAETGIAADRLLGAGIVMPGPFGRTGLRDAATELPGWSETAPAPWFEQRLGLPAVVENDANAAAVAERLSGAARGLSAFAFLYFGTGLGLGIVSGGGLVRGAFGNAGEIGHIPIGGRRLEEVASRLALGRRLAAAGLPAGTVEDLARALDAGHPALTGWLDEAAEALGQAVLILENLLDPETLILGGALPDALIDALIARIPLSAGSVSNRPGRPLPRLLRGAAGRMTAALGAGALVLDRAFTPRLADT